mgnify:CR=1 FL=1
MKRLDFIKLNALAGIGFGVMPFDNLQHKPDVDFLTGKHNPYLNDSGIIHKLAYRSFIKMRESALNDGINIQIVSGFRSFDRQLQIWNNKYRSYRSQGLSDDLIIKKITAYSTIPGTSRHHWGTDIDIIDRNVNVPENNLLAEANYHGNGVFCKLNEWMQNYAQDFGFHLVYTDNYHRTGFNYEPWHYSYLPLSKTYLHHYQKIDLKDIFIDIEIEGKMFLDENCLKSYFETHLLGINPKLLS